MCCPDALVSEFGFPAFKLPLLDTLGLFATGGEGEVLDFAVDAPHPIKTVFV